MAKVGAKLGKQAVEEIAMAARPDTIFAWDRKVAGQPLAVSEPPKFVVRPRVDYEFKD